MQEISRRDDRQRKCGAGTDGLTNGRKTSDVGKKKR